ncbi:MAG: hypothetical protein R3E64_16335 [Halioglobus sp.]
MKKIVFMALTLLLSSSLYAATLGGTYVADNGDTYIFSGDGTGKFIQVRSINGNPGKVITEFDWSLDGKEITVVHTKKILIGSAGYDQEQEINKKFSANIEYDDTKFVAGSTYWKQ